MLEWFGFCFGRFAWLIGVARCGRVAVEWFLDRITTGCPSDALAAADVTKDISTGAAVFDF